MTMLPRTLRQKPGFRFAIRPYAADDGDALHEAIDESRTHVATWMDWLHAKYGRDDVELWVREAVASWEEGRAHQFVIVDLEDGRLAGSCGLQDLRPKDQVACLGYWVRATKLRLGAARQAGELALGFGFGELGLNRIEIIAAVDNAASRAVARALGAQPEGVLKSRIRVGGVFLDAWMHAVVRGGASTPSPAS